MALRVNLALMLCGGKAKRLRPYSHILPKSSLPFLNLPLLAYPWFYLESLRVSNFLLNSHLFPLQLESTVQFLLKPNQTAEFFFEEEPLGAIGTLQRLKDKLKRAPYFFLINGDSLFLPSVNLKSFEEEFFKSESDALFFASPYKNSGRALFFDSKSFLTRVEKPKESEKQLGASFTGLALFRSEILDSLPFQGEDLFKDFILPLLAQYKIKVFVDKEAVLLEAGSKASYLQSTEFCLRQLFYEELSSKETLKNYKKIRNSRSFIYRQVLEDCFKSFDPSNQRVGFDKQEFHRWGSPALIPSSLKGSEFLSIKGFAVLGPHVHLFGSSLLEESVLDSHLFFRGDLSNDLLVRPSNLYK